MAKGDRRRRTRQRAAKAAREAAQPGSRRISRSEREAKLIVDATVTKEAQAKGDYAYVDHKIVEVVEGGKVKAKVAQVVMNRGRTTLDRWFFGHKLEDRQMAAIVFFQEAYRRAFGSQRVTANYCPDVIRSSADDAVRKWAASRANALITLRLLDQIVFLDERFERYSLWVNVLIHDQPAGIAGGLLGFRSLKQAEAVALETVSSLSHRVANVVIDTPRRDLEALLQELDFDAPRRPGSKAA